MVYRHRGDIRTAQGGGMFTQINVGQDLAFMLHFIYQWWGEGRGGPWYAINEHEVYMGVILIKGHSHRGCCFISCFIMQVPWRPETGTVINVDETLISTRVRCTTGIPKWFHSPSLPCCTQTDVLVLRWPNYSVHAVIQLKITVGTLIRRDLYMTSMWDKELRAWVLPFSKPSN